MENLLIEAAIELAQEWAKSTESKQQLKRVVIDYLNDENNDGYFLADKFLLGFLTQDDWKEIAKAVGEDICVNCGVVSTKFARLPEEFEPQWYKV